MAVSCCKQPAKVFGLQLQTAAAPLANIPRLGPHPSAGIRGAEGSGAVGLSHSERGLKDSKGWARETHRPCARRGAVPGTVPGLWRRGPCRLSILWVSRVPSSAPAGC